MLLPSRTCSGSRRDNDSKSHNRNTESCYKPGSPKCFIYYLSTDPISLELGIIIPILRMRKMKLGKLDILSI